MNINDYDAEYEGLNGRGVPLDIYKRNYYLKTKLDGCFQRYGGVERDSGWTTTNSCDFIDALIGGTIYNQIINVDVEAALKHAYDVGDSDSIAYFTTALGEGYKFVNLDGNNTGSTINAFLNNLEGIKSLKENKYFREYTELEQHAIAHQLKITVITLRKIGIAEMCEFFRRRNRQTALNGQEYRQAVWSHLSRFIRDLSNLPEVRTMFTHFVFQNKSLDKRSHEETLAQLTMKVSTSKTAFTKTELHKFYDNTPRLSVEAEKDISKIVKIAAKMAQQHGVLANNKGTRFSRGQLLVLFDVIREITAVKGYNIKSPNTVFKWFVKKDHVFRQASKTVTAEDAREKSYQYWVEHMNERALWQRCLKKMMEAFEEVEEEWVDAGHITATRTSADSFTGDQKEELLYLQEGRTRAGEEIDLFDLYGGHLEADHVISVKDGGPTEIWNGEMMLTADNRSKGSQSNEPFFAFQEEAPNKESDC